MKLIFLFVLIFVLPHSSQETVPALPAEVLPAKWASGDGSGGPEEKIGVFASKDVCYAMCSKREKNGLLANGATVDSKTEKTCYCEYGQNGRQTDGHWINTFIERVLHASWTYGDGSGGSEEKIGVFANSEICFAMCSKRKKDGVLANGATVDRKTWKTCYCEYGQNVTNNDQKWVNTFIVRV